MEYVSGCLWIVEAERVRVRAPQNADDMSKSSNSPMSAYDAAQGES